MTVMEDLVAAGRQVELVQLEEMYPAPWNPRSITEERLADLRRSMEHDPAHLWARPLMIREDGMVIGGNQRLRAGGLEPAYEALPAVRMIGLSDEDAKLIALRDNAGYGVWEDAQVAEILGGLGAAGVDLGLSGFTSESITGLLDGFRAEAPAAGPDRDDAPPLPKKARSKLGEIYELGAHRLACGDSRDADLLAKLMGDDKANLMFTDPPYGVAYLNEMSVEEAKILNRRTDGLEVANDALTQDETNALITSVLENARGVMRPGAAYYVCAPSMMLRDFIPAMDAAGMPMRHGLVWVKDRFTFGRPDFHYRHEMILYGWLKGRAHYFVNDRTLDSVWEIARPSRSPEHPTMKPVELVERALTASSKRGGIVLDPFGGSGSTLIACEVLGRKCRTVELDPKYADVIRARYENLVGD